MRWKSKPPLGTRINMSHPLSRGLVGLWLFAEGAGERVSDVSGNQNNGLMTNFVLGATSGWKGGRTGKAVMFDGTDDYVDVTLKSGLPIYNSPGLNYSVAFWVRAAAVSDRRVYAEGSSSSNNPALFIGTGSAGTSKLRVFIRNDANVVTLNGIETTNTVFDNTWHHVVFTDENGTARCYVDGALDPTSFNYTRSGTLTMDRIAIGRVSRLSPGFYFPGSIDDVRVYNRALTAQEVRSLYTNPFEIFDTFSLNDLYNPNVFVPRVIFA